MSDNDNGFIDALEARRKEEDKMRERLARDHSLTLKQEQVIKSGKQSNRDFPGRS